MKTTRTSQVRIPVPFQDQQAMDNTMQKPMNKTAIKQLSGALLAVALSTVSVHAAGTDTWIGNTDANWNTAANWTTSGGSTPPANGDSLVFGAAGSSGSSLNNNISDLSVNKLTFNSGASSFTFGGRNITLGTGGIDASALTGGTQTFAFTNVIGNGLQRWNVGTGATLAFGKLGAGGAADNTYGPNGAIVILSKTGTITTTTADGWGWRGGAVAGTGLLGPGMVIDNGDNTYDWASAGNSGGTIVAATYTTAANSDAHNVKVTGNTTVTPNASWASLLVQGATLTHNGGNIYLDTGIILQNGGAIAGSGPIKANNDGLYIHVPDTGTIASSIQNNGANARLLYKAGPGTLTLSGANTYTGNTVVYEGALIQSTAATGAGSYTVKDGATLGVSGSGTLRMSSLSFGNSTNTYGGVAATPAITVTGALTLAGRVTVNVGGLIIPVGQYPLITSASIGGSGGFVAGTLPPGVVGNIITNGNTITLSVTASAAPTFLWTGLNNNSWDFSTADNWSSDGAPAVYVDNQILRFDDSSVQTNVNIATSVVPLSLVVSNSASRYTFSGAAITGLSRLTKDGSGTLVLANTNTSTGGTIISNGTLQLGNVPGNNGVVAGNITDNGRLIFANSANETFAGVISGIGTLVKSGTNELTLSSSNNFAGSLTVSNGVLTVTKTAGQSLGTNISVRDGAAFRVVAKSDATYLSPATLTVGSSSGATLQFGVANTNNPILTPGAVILNGTTTIKILSCPFATNSYPLFSGYTSGTLALGAQPQGYTGSLTVQGGTVYYRVTALNPAYRPFVHPGCLSTAADLERIKAKLAAGAEPWTSAYAVLANNGHSSASYTAHPYEYINRGGANQNYSAVMNDAAAAYQSALRWRLTGDTNFAECAMRNMDGYSSTLILFGGSTDALLMLGAQGFDFACAAELLRDYQPWVNSGGFDRFKTFLLEKIYENPANGAGLRGFLNSHNGTCWSHYWLNWEGFALSAAAAIGVVCDRRDILDHAVNYYKTTGVGNGLATHAVYFMHPGYLGQSQEMGRDMGHASLDPVLFAQFAEVAWNQGEDIYGFNDNGILAMSEYTSRVMTGDETPWVNYAGCDVNTTGRASGSMYRAGLDMLWNHYVNRRGLSAPYTMASALGNRPEGGGGNYGGNSGGFDQIGFTTLTHALDPFTNSPAPSALKADAPLAGTARVWWYGSAYATGYNVKRATSVGGPYSLVATNLTPKDLLCTDTNLTPDTTYYYVVSAIVNGVETTNSLPVSVTANRRLSGTVIGAGSVIINGQGIYQLFDNAPITWFDCSAPSGGWAGLDLGTPYRITKVGYYPRIGNAGRMTGGRFQGCNVADFSSGVVTLFTIGSQPPEGMTTIQNVGDTNGYRYVRYIGPVNGYCNVADLQFQGVPGVAAPVPPLPPPTLKAYLKFDESSGTSAADATGHGWTGTLVNSASHVAGYSNNAVNLSGGSSQYVTLPGGVVSDLEAFSITAWVKLTTISTWSRIFDFGTGQSVYMFLAPQNGVNNSVRFAITTGGGAGEQVIDGTAPLPAGVWTHVAVTVSGTTGLLYVDGVLVGANSSMAMNPSFLGNTTQNYIGKSQYNDPYFDGQVDEFRIYNGALSASEVATFLTPLAAPENVTAIGGGGQVVLNWDAAANAGSYRIFRSTSSGGPFTQITNVTATAFTNTALANGVMYHYVIRAANAVGESPNSVQVSARPVSMTQPAGSAALIGGQLQLSWPADHTGWRLEMNTDLAGTNWLDVPGANGTNALSIPTTNGGIFYRLVYP
jgi:autotransporter-associated beta strand protein